MNKKIKALYLHFLKNSERKKTLILILALIGILFMLLGDVLSKKAENNPNMLEEEETMGAQADIQEVALLTNVNEIEASYEKDLQMMLNKIKGVSEVEVMVNLDSTNINMYEKDLIYGVQTTEETDKGGGKRNIEDETKETKLVYIRQGDQEVPVLIKTKKPEVRGVFVIAKGVDNAAVKQLVVEAVSRVLDVPTYRISVLPK